MNRKTLEEAVAAAFEHAAGRMGDRVKGMSCFVKQWRAPVPQVEKAAA